VLWAEHALTRAHLTHIAKRVSEINPDIRSFVIPHHRLPQLKLFRTWFQPTLSLSFFGITKRKLLPGRVATGSLLHKHGEYARFDNAGIPVPLWTVITPDTRLDPAVWGPYVVEKPSAGRLGSYVRIRKTTRVGYLPPESFPPDHYGHQGPMLAQQFVYTGEWPTSYRVVTLFGEVLLCYRQISRTRGHPLQSRWNFRNQGGISIVSNTKDMKIELVKDPSVIALAERAHRQAFPDLPVLSFDIIRDVESGSLFVLECHAGGSWFFSSDMGLAIEAANNVDFMSQFDAIEKAAHVIARETPLRATTRWPSLVEQSLGQSE
jgi:hypothetical protein